MITYCRPLSGPSTGTSASPERIVSPSDSSSRTSATFSGSANHSATSSARSGPIPSVSSRSSWLAAISASTEPKWRARLRASTQPIFGMLRPNRTRENGWAFEASIDAIARAADTSA